MPGCQPLLQRRRLEPLQQPHQRGLHARPSPPFRASARRRMPRARLPVTACSRARSGCRSAATASSVVTANFSALLSRARSIVCSTRNSFFIAAREIRTWRSPSDHCRGTWRPAPARNRRFRIGWPDGQAGHRPRPRGSREQPAPRRRHQSAAGCGAWMVGPGDRRRRRRRGRRRVWRGWQRPGFCWAAARRHRRRRRVQGSRRRDRLAGRRLGADSRASMIDSHSKFGPAITFRRGERHAAGVRHCRPATALARPPSASCPGTGRHPRVGTARRGSFVGQVERIVRPRGRRRRRRSDARNRAAADAERIVQRIAGSGSGAAVGAARPPVAPLRRGTAARAHPGPACGRIRLPGSHIRRCRNSSPSVSAISPSRGTRSGDR